MTHRDYTQRSLLRTTLLFMAADCAAVALCGVASVQIRYFFEGQFDPLMYYDHWPVLFLFILIYAGMGLYPGVLLPPAEELKKSFWASSLMFLALGAGTFMSKGGHIYSRGIFVMGWFFTAAGVPLARSLVRSLAAGTKWYGLRAVIFDPGPPGGVGDILARTLRRHPRMGVKPELLVLTGDHRKEDAREVDAVNLDAFMDRAGEYRDAYAIVVMPEHDAGRTQSIIQRLGRHFQKLILAPNLAVQSSLWASTVDFGGFLGLELKQKLLDPKRLAYKRCFDIVAASLACLLLAPLFLALFVVVKTDSKGPAFYGHTRLGRNGKPFTIYKFRTMVCNGEELLQEHLCRHPECRAEWETNRKLKCDPRVTKIGRFLRKYSLDELPQLWNVVRGDLSLVGPRPIVEDEVDEYSRSIEDYHRVRPGITGLWQISGRNNTTYSERVDLDTYYINNWSIWLDIYILVRTPCIVLRGEGAY